MTTIRQERASELLYQELSILIGNELDDPLLELLTVTNVVVSKDLRVAKVYVYQDGDDIRRQAMLSKLKKAIPFLRRQLAQRVNLRAVPELLFYYDDTPSQAARVDELLQRIAQERTSSQETEPGELPDSTPLESGPSGTNRFNSEKDTSNPEKEDA